MSELSEELRDLQAVCERLGVDDDDALNRAADRIEELEAQLAEAKTSVPVMAFNDLIDRNIKLEAQLEAVRPYLRHKYTCPYQLMGEKYNCDCGLKAAIGEGE